MSNDLSLFESGSVPAHIAALASQLSNTDLSAGVSTGFPIISIKGKVWHLVQGGVRTLIENDEGEPRQSIEVVILKSNPAISKVYYEGGYVEGSDDRPTCFSHDGVAPSAESTAKQALKCAICPRNQWGSRITENGAKGKECADSRRLAVAPSLDLENAMLLRVPAASLKDLVAYGDMLTKRATPYQAVVTKISFDHTVAHQKLIFKPLRWLTAEEVATVAEVMESTTVEQIIGAAALPGEYVAPEEDPLGSMEGERPTNIGAVAKGRAATAADIAAAIAPKAAPAPAPVAQTRPAATKPKAASGFGAPSAAQKAAAAAALAEEVKAIAPEVIEGVATPVAAKAAPKDHSALLAEASASLEDVLATFDD